ncbi:YgaP-like transmembrane domain [Kaarinaea lacus]
MENITQNKMGIIERIIRIGIGYSLIVTTMFSSEPGSFILLFLLLSIYPILTGIFGWDPVRARLGKRFKAAIRYVDQKMVHHVEDSLFKTSQHLNYDDADECNNAEDEPQLSRENSEYRIKA